MTSATTTATPIAAVAVPDDSRAARAYAAVDLADAYEIRLPAGTTTDPGVLARFIFANQPRWVGVLMRLRDAIVGRLGLKTAGGLQRAAGERVGIFKVLRKARPSGCSARTTGTWTSASRCCTACATWRASALRTWSCRRSCIATIGSAASTSS
jgi:hypothetical protein